MVPYLLRDVTAHQLLPPVCRDATRRADSARYRKAAQNFSVIPQLE